MTTFSVLAGSVCAVAVLLSYAAAREESIAGDQARTAAVIATMVVSLWVLVLAARPLRAWKLALVLAVATVLGAAFVTPGVNAFFSIDHRPSLEVVLQSVGFGAVACAVIAAGVVVIDRRRPASRS